MKNRLVRTAVFLCVLIFVLNATMKVFRYKYEDGIYAWDKIYELEDNMVDVMFLGSSHAFTSFDTGLLWRENGIASFVLGGPVQPMWNTYYVLREVLKTQTPKLIVLEGFSTVVEIQYQEDPYVIKNLYGMHWSRNKVKAILESTTKEHWKNLFLPWSEYHSRYTELDRSDFAENRGEPLYRDWKGYMMRLQTMPFEDLTPVSTKEEVPLAEPTEKYFRAILELAKEKEIPIAVAIVPFAEHTDILQRSFNRAGAIASEYGIPFWDLTGQTEEIGIDFRTDASDGGHLNYKGAEKLTRFITEKLKETAELPDRRADEKYRSWERDARCLQRQAQGQDLRACTDLDAKAALLEGEGYRLFVSVQGTYSGAEEIHPFLEKLGILEEESQGIWSAADGRVDWTSSQGGGETYYSTPGHEICLRSTKTENGELISEIIADRTECSVVRNGLNVVVYDPVLDCITDRFGVDAADGWKLVSGE